MLLQARVILGMRYHRGAGECVSTDAASVAPSVQEVSSDLLDKYAALAGLGQSSKGLLSKSAVRVRNAVLG